MDGTTGGTMTPPRDTDATTEDFAPVIPLRRRQPDPAATRAPALDDDAGAGGIWDPDAPPASLTARRPPHDPATEALAAVVAGSLDSSRSEGADLPPASRGARTVLGAHRRSGQLAALCGVLAIAAALALALAGVGRPHPTHLAKAPSTAAPEHAVTNAPTALRPKLHTHALGTRIDRRSRAHPKHSRKTAAQKVTLAASAHASLAGAVVSESTTGTPTQTAPTQTQASSADQTTRPGHQLEAAIRRAAAACVPGELGC